MVVIKNVLTGLVLKSESEQSFGTIPSASYASIDGLLNNRIILNWKISIINENLSLLPRNTQTENICGVLDTKGVGNEEAHRHHLCNTNTKVTARLLPHLCVTT